MMVGCVYCSIGCCELFMICVFVYLLFFFFKQKTAYEMRISDWSSDVCSSDLIEGIGSAVTAGLAARAVEPRHGGGKTHGHAPTRCLNCGTRSEERRVGKEGVSTCRSRWSLYHEKTNTNSTTHSGYLYS